MLVAKGAFDMIDLGFLMVGHTSKNLDALFIPFLEELRTTQIFSFLNLMKNFYEYI